jgi:hypothetical protein
VFDAMSEAKFGFFKGVDAVRIRHLASGFYDGEFKGETAAEKEQRRAAVLMELGTPREQRLVAFLKARHEEVWREFLASEGKGEAQAMVGEKTREGDSTKARKEPEACLPQAKLLLGQLLPRSEAKLARRLLQEALDSGLEQAREFLETRAPVPFDGVSDGSLFEGFEVCLKAALRAPFSSVPRYSKMTI